MFERNEIFAEILFNSEHKTVALLNRSRDFLHCVTLKIPERKCCTVSYICQMQSTFKKPWDLP